MARWSKCDVPVKVVRESWRVPKMEWLFEPQTLADEVHVAQAVLPAGEGGTAVHVMNKTPSSYIVDEGSEVGHANMAGDVSHSVVNQLQEEELAEENGEAEGKKTDKQKHPIYVL